MVLINLQPLRSNQMIFQLLYISEAKSTWSKEQLCALVAHSQVYNQQHGISGVLVHSGEMFIQLLEGEEKTVGALFDKIKQDERHQRVGVVFERHAEDRLTPQWAMAYCELSQKEFADSRLKTMPLSALSEKQTDQPDVTWQMFQAFVDETKIEHAVTSHDTAQKN